MELQLNLIINSSAAQILLVQSYTEIPELSFIIKSCRLKPYSYFFKEQSNKIILYSWWFDECGRISLHILSSSFIHWSFNGPMMFRSLMQWSIMFCSLMYIVLFINSESIVEILLIFRNLCVADSHAYSVPAIWLTGLASKMLCHCVKFATVRN